MPKYKCKDCGREGGLLYTLPSGIMVHLIACESYGVSPHIDTITRARMRQVLVQGFSVTVALTGLWAIDKVLLNLAFPEL